MKKIFIALFAYVSIYMAFSSTIFSDNFSLKAQQTFPVNEVKNDKNGFYALQNATVWVDFQTKIENATLIIKNGVVEAVGANLAAPSGAIIIDLKGKHVYPSFIEIYSNYGLPVAKMPNYGNTPQYETNKRGAFNWNQTIQPENNAADVFKNDDTSADAMRKMGFGATLTHLQDGLARGTGALVSLHNERENLIILKKNASNHFSFNNGSSAQQYPNSIMGRIALLRQTHLDADWYKKSALNQSASRETNLSLDAFNNNFALPTFFETNGKLNALRADKLGDEFAKQYILKVTGDEYQRIDEIKATNAPLVVPVNFPDAYDVDDPYDALNVSLAELKHWELAPTNLSVLAKNNINFAITTADLKDKTKFMANLLKAIENGLDKKTALKALTFVPAQLLGMEKQLGSLQKGFMANFMITNKELFEKDTKIQENWVQGSRYRFSEISVTDIRGTYNIQISTNNLLNLSGKLFIEGDLETPTYKLLFPNDTNKIEVKAIRDKNLITLSFNADKAKTQNITRLSGYFADNTVMIIKGDAQSPDGNWGKFTATLSQNFVEKKDDKKPEEPKKSELGKVIFPFLAHGNEQKLTQETVLFKNATVWTNEKDGILTNTDVLVKDGKISQIGKNLTLANASAGGRTIDATNKHLTSGIIDEHSHIALSGVNEASQSVTAEVRMYDAVNSEDINIYRNLSGGVTAAQLLHGSANCIGGQSALIKLKWGENPEKMRITGADGFIKFALGENVKQSNWGDDNTIRFPQTRMGVEQVMIDAFTRAKEYEKQIKSGKPYRKDLELDALLEIVNSKRFITCHSYVQSEINMLMKVAEQFNFKINTFTHILEGYKLAGAMAKHGAGASTFADWWAYKNEVKDAIPYNAALMHEKGVLVSINSDDPEMSRRLNQEAAKVVKYGNISEIEAWKMVTLNPAKLLHLDKRTGSIAVGKDADLVLWSDNPLSIYAKAEKTIIEGTVYFDIEKDLLARNYIQKERSRIMQKMIDAKNGGAPAQKTAPKKQHIRHCEDLHNEEE